MNKKSQQKRREYDTPGRVCQHADSGCCPRCLAIGKKVPRIHGGGGIRFTTARGKHPSIYEIV